MPAALWQPPHSRAAQRPSPAPFLSRLVSSKPESQHERGIERLSRHALWRNAAFLRVVLTHGERDAITE